VLNFLVQIFNIICYKTPQGLASILNWIKDINFYVKLKSNQLIYEIFVASDL
jgi:hypothetical protein